MATEAKKLQPIIIKRVKKGGHAAHGGAWKIAYADFVTAMMAFFLLMWLLGSTTEGDKKGLSDFFQSPLKVAMLGGSGAGSSNNLIIGGGSDLTQSAGSTRKGDGEVKKTSSQKQKKEQQAKEDARKLAELSAKISAIITNTPALAEFSKQIILRMTPDGLQIQIVDEQNRPMFDSGSDVVKPYMRTILQEIGKALTGIDNRISLDGHTDQTPYSSGVLGYSNWELSADRANASRRELVRAGMPDEQIARVMGLASSVLMDHNDPRGPANRRISITVMTREAEERLLGPRPAELEPPGPLEPPEPAP